MDTVFEILEKNVDKRNSQLISPNLSSSLILDKRREYNPLQDQINQLAKQVSLIQIGMKHHEQINKNVELSEAIYQLRNCSKLIPPFEECLQNQTNLSDQYSALFLRVHDWVAIVEQHSLKLANLDEKVRYHIEDKNVLDQNPAFQAYIKKITSEFDSKLQQLEANVPTFEGLNSIMKHQMDLVMINDYYRNRLGLLEKAMSSYEEFKTSQISDKLQQLENSNKHLLEKSELIKNDLISKVDQIEQKMKMSNEQITKLSTSSAVNNNNSQKNTKSVFDKLGSDFLNGGFIAGIPMKVFQDQLVNPKLDIFKQEHQNLINKIESKLLEVENQTQTILKKQDNGEGMDRKTYQKIQNLLETNNQLNIQTFKEILEYKIKEVSDQTESQKNNILERMHNLQQIIFNRFQQNNSSNSFDSPLNSTSIDSSTEKISLNPLSKNVNETIQQEIANKLKNYIDINSFNQLVSENKQLQSVVQQLQKEIEMMKDSVLSTTLNISKENESLIRENKRLLAQSRELAAEILYLKDRTGKGKDSYNHNGQLNKTFQNKTLQTFSGQINQPVVQQNQGVPSLNLNESSPPQCFFKLNPQSLALTQRSRILKPIASVHSRTQTIKNVAQFVNQSIDLLPEVNEQSQLLENESQIYQNSNRKEQSVSNRSLLDQTIVAHSNSNQSPDPSNLHSILKNKYEIEQDIKLSGSQELIELNKSRNGLYIQTPTIITRNKTIRDEDYNKNKSQDRQAQIQVAAKGNQIQLKKFNNIIDLNSHSQQNKINLDLKKINDIGLLRQSFQ